MHSTQVLLPVYVTLLSKDSHSLAGHSRPPLHSFPELMPCPHPPLLLSNWPTGYSLPRLYQCLEKTLSSHSQDTVHCSLLHKTFPNQMWSPPLLFHLPSLNIHLSSLTIISFLITIHINPQCKREL